MLVVWMANMEEKRFTVVTVDDATLTANDVLPQILLNGQKVLTGFGASTDPHVFQPIWDIPWVDVKAVYDHKHNPNKNIKTARSIRRHGCHVDNVRDLRRMYSITMRSV